MFRRKANKMRDYLESAQKPDRTKLHKEAKEFEQFIRVRRLMDDQESSYAISADVTMPVYNPDDIN